MSDPIKQMADELAGSDEIGKKLSEKAKQLGDSAKDAEISLKREDVNKYGKLAKGAKDIALAIGGLKAELGKRKVTEGITAYKQGQVAFEQELSNPRLSVQERQDLLDSGRLDTLKKTFEKDTSSVIDKQFVKANLSNIESNNMAFYLKWQNKIVQQETSNQTQDVVGLIDDGSSKARINPYDPSLADFRNDLTLKIDSININPEKRRDLKKKAVGTILYNRALGLIDRAEFNEVDSILKDENQLSLLTAGQVGHIKNMRGSSIKSAPNKLFKAGRLAFGTGQFNQFKARAANYGEEGNKFISFTENIQRNLNSQIKNKRGIQFSPEQINAASKQHFKGDLEGQHKAKQMLEGYNKFAETDPVQALRNVYGDKYVDGLPPEQLTALTGGRLLSNSKSVEIAELKYAAIDNPKEARKLQVMQVRHGRDWSILEREADRIYKKLHPNMDENKTNRYSLYEANRNGIPKDIQNNAANYVKSGDAAIVDPEVVSPLETKLEGFFGEDANDIKRVAQLDASEKARKDAKADFALSGTEYKRDAKYLYTMHYEKTLKKIIKEANSKQIQEAGTLWGFNVVKNRLGKDGSDIKLEKDLAAKQPNGVENAKTFINKVGELEYFTKENRDMFDPKQMNELDKGKYKIEFHRSGTTLIPYAVNKDSPRDQFRLKLADGSKASVPEYDISAKSKDWFSKTPRLGKVFNENTTVIDGYDMELKKKVAIMKKSNAIKTLRDMKGTPKGMRMYMLLDQASTAESQYDASKRVDKSLNTYNNITDSFSAKVADLTPNLRKALRRKHIIILTIAADHYKNTDFINDMTAQDIKDVFHGIPFDDPKLNEKIVKVLGFTGNAGEALNNSVKEEKREKYNTFNTNILRGINGTAADINTFLEEQI